MKFKVIIHKKKSIKFDVNIKKVIIVGIVILFLLNFVGLFEIRITPNKRLQSVIGKLYPSPTPIPKPTVKTLSAKVIPGKGYQLNIKWGDIGKKLIETGAIDMNKYKDNYGDEYYQDLLTYLTETKKEGIRLDEKNAYFWVNTLWALGLTQKSDVLDNGVMGKEYGDQIGNFASTGGWTLGAKDAVSLYSSSEIVTLSKDQQKLIEKISSGIYRPCCGNPTSFPDCNHGMAILGLIEIMVSQGFSENEIYKAALAFNSFWFPDTYVDLAYYFQTKENTVWDKVDPKRALSAEFSSAQGYLAIKEKIDEIPGSKSSGASCGA